MDYGRHEMDSRKVDVSMKKVMGAVAETTEVKQKSGGIMQPGSYSKKTMSADAHKVDYSYSGPGYKGD